MYSQFMLHGQKNINLKPMSVHYFLSETLQS